MYPTASVVAIGTLLVGGRVAKLKMRESNETIHSLSIDSLSSMRAGLSMLSTVHRVLAKDPFRYTPGQNPSAEVFLEEAHNRFQRANREWAQGKFQAAGRSADEVLWLLSGVAGDLSAPQTQIRDALQEQLSGLIVRLNEVEAGKDKPAQEPAEPLGPLDLELNAAVQKEIDRFATTQRSTFLQGYELAGAHMPYIQKKLVEHGLPSALGWLPLIESGFKLRAQSGAKALGLWQFMPKTGDQFGLVRDRWIDSRMDPEMATEAAVVYLKYLYNTFGGDWQKALAAYNWGEGNVRKAIDQLHRSDDQVSFWDLSPRLPEETRRYVPKFLATVHIVQEPERFGFDELGSLTVPQRYETVQLEKQMDMDTVANVLGIAPPELSNLNPELLQRVTPPQKHLFRVPAGYGHLLLARLDQIPEYRPRAKLPQSVKIKQVSKNRRKSHVMTASTGKSKARVLGATKKASTRTKANAKARMAGPKKSMKASPSKPTSKKAKSKRKTRNG